MNPNFKATFGARQSGWMRTAASFLLCAALTPCLSAGRADKKFKNKMSRVIIACQDGGRRSEIAAEMVTGLGYTAIALVEGGVEAYLKVSPLKESDKKARVARVEQQVGIKYGGTGVTSEQTPGAQPRRRLGMRARAARVALSTRADARLRSRQTTAPKRLRLGRGAPGARLRRLGGARPGAAARFYAMFCDADRRRVRAACPEALRRSRGLVARPRCRPKLRRGAEKLGHRRVGCARVVVRGRAPPQQRASSPPVASTAVARNAGPAGEAVGRGARRLHSPEGAGGSRCARRIRACADALTPRRRRAAARASRACGACAPALHAGGRVANASRRHLAGVARLGSAKRGRAASALRCGVTCRLLRP